MKTLITLSVLLLLQLQLRSQTIIFHENFDGMPSYSLTGWPYSFTGVVPWQCGLPYQVGPCMIPLGAAMAENSGTNKVACFAECTGPDHYDSNVLTISPFINMTPVTGAWLKYDSYFAGYAHLGHTEKATVEISTDSGTTWTVLENVAPSAPQGLFDAHYIDLSAYNNAGNIRLGFRYNDDGGFQMMGWAIDNITVFVPAEHDISMLSATPTDTMLSYINLSTPYTHKVKIYNNGLDAIHAFDLHYAQDGGPTKVSHITGINLPSFNTAEYTHTILDSVFTMGRHTVRIWATLDSDTYHNNDSGITHLTGVGFMPSKRLAIESGEGTYNGWSPRNMYYLRSVPGLDINASLISIHEADPMVDTVYHDFMFNLGWNYVPYILFDRRKSIQLDSFFYYINVQKQYFGFADMSLISSVSGDQFTVTTTVKPAITMTGDFRLVMVLTEDAVTGNTIAYDQVNNFAANAHGPMGGYESLANPIPHADMVYNYVARTAYPSPDGAAGLLPTTLNFGESYVGILTATLNPAWNINKLHAKILLIRHNDSTILNSAEVASTVKVANVNAAFSNAGLYPNPAQETTTLYFDIPTPQTIHIILSDITGRTLYNHSAPSSNTGRNELQIPVNQLANGIYLLTMKSEEGQKTVKLEVTH